MNDSIALLCILLAGALWLRARRRRSVFDLARSPSLALLATLATLAPCFARSARADGVVLAPPAVVVVTPPSATPAPVTVSGDELMAKVSAVTAALADLQVKLGVPAGPVAPPSFWSTKAGYALTITFAVLGAAAAVATTTVTIYEAVK